MAPPAVLRRPRAGAGDHGPHQRPEAEPPGPRLPLHRPPRRGQDHPGPDPGQGRQLPEVTGPHARPLRRVRLLPADHGRRRPRRPGDRRGLQHRRGQRPRASGERPLRAVPQPLQDLHHRRSPHALQRRVQRPPEDVGGAPAPGEVFLRHHRAAQASGDHRFPLPALRPPPDPPRLHPRPSEEDRPGRRGLLRGGGPPRGGRRRRRLRARRRVDLRPDPGLLRPEGDRPGRPRPAGAGPGRDLKRLRPGGRFRRRARPPRPGQRRLQPGLVRPPVRLLAGPPLPRPSGRRPRGETRGDDRSHPGSTPRRPRPPPRLPPPPALLHPRGADRPGALDQGRALRAGGPGDGAA